MRSGVRFSCTNRKCKKYKKPTLRSFDSLSEVNCFLCDKKLERLEPINKRKIDKEKIEQELRGES
jgi:hypothetical protein